MTITFTASTIACIVVFALLALAIAFLLGMLLAFKIAEEQTEELLRRVRDRYLTKNRTEDTMVFGNVDVCICCGKPVPEGRLVCPECE